MAYPIRTCLRFARKLDAALFLDHAEFFHGHGIDILVVDTLDIEIDIARQFQVQCQRTLPSRRHLEFFVQDGWRCVGRQVLLLIGSAIYVFQHVADVGVERRHPVFTDIAFVKRQTVLDAVTISGNRYEPYERQAAGENSRTTAEDILALAGHVPVETHAGSYRQTCLGHIRGLVAAVVGELLRELLVLVVCDRRIDRNFETHSDGCLETVTETDLILQVNRVLHVGERRICLLQPVVVAVGNTKRQRFFVVFEIVPTFVNIITCAALLVSIGCEIVLELQTCHQSVFTDRVADLIGHDMRRYFTQVTFGEGIETERSVQGADALVVGDESGFQNVHRREDAAVITARLILMRIGVTQRVGQTAVEETRVQFGGYRREVLLLIVARVFEIHGVVRETTIGILVVYFSGFER